MHFHSPYFILITLYWRSLKLFPNDQKPPLLSNIFQNQKSQVFPQSSLTPYSHQVIYNLLFCLFDISNSFYPQSNISAFPTNIDNAISLGASIPNPQIPLFFHKNPCNFILKVGPPLLIQSLIYNCHTIIQLRNMDIWKYKTQGFNYEKYRPEYPQELCHHAIDSLSNRKRYLDLAVGTGKILLSFCENFEEIKGIDVSEQMLSVAQANVEKFMESHPTHSILLEKNHVMQLNEEEKFDLITVGQALHFFPGEPTLRKIRNMLNDGGMFMTFGYVLREVKSENDKENKIFYDFYNKMLPYFTFDMYELHHHYTDKARYPFEDIFERVDRKQTDLILTLTKEEYINYLKTWSAYNIYQEKMGLDPIIELMENSADKLTCVFDYFRVRCFK